MTNGGGRHVEVESTTTQEKPATEGKVRPVPDSAKDGEEKLDAGTSLADGSAESDN